MLEAARAFASKGVSVVPTKANKTPAVAWASFQSHIPTAIELATMFADAVGVGAVCGRVSGCLECIDFDDPELYPLWRETLEINGYEGLLALLVVQQTQNGGYHVVYRCADGVQGNLKLAWAMDDALGKRIRIETRGEGGYFQACPSPGYKMVQGTWGKIPTISAEDRDALFSAARTFNDWVMPMTHYASTQFNRPGDEYGKSHTWRDILEPEGWTFAYERDGEEHWVRPGKTKRQGIGATTNYRNSDVMKVFTSHGSPFEPDKTYTKFCAYATLRHGGNMIEAARSLGAKGFGEHRKAYVPPLPVQDAPDRAGQRWLRATEIKEQKIDWLWDLYIPIGEVTMIVGNPGDGKSTVAQAIVTAVTLGSELFGDRVANGSAVFLSAEQSVATVTVPRFRRMGADLSQIILPDEVNDQDEPVPFVLDKSGMEELRAVCTAERPKVVVIDTVTAYIEASRDFNSANQTREWMRRLAEIARTTPCAVVLLGHLNKNSSAHPLMRILGSIDFVGASRSVLLVGKDPDEQDTRGIAQIKSNVGPFGEPRGFRLDGDEFSWTDGSRLDAARMLQPAAIQAALTSRERCEHWMRGLFRDTNVVEAPKRDDGGKTNGFTTYVVDATKKKLGVISVKDSMADGGWAWKMGDDDVYRGGD